MKYEEARAIFGSDIDDDEKEIKNKYRKLMQRYHPDAHTGDADDLKHAEAMAILINEAYNILKNEKMHGSEQLKRYRWPGRVNKHALYERDIFMTVEDSRNRRLGSFKIARGKYVWDPDLEDFDMFVSSVMDLARELLNQTEQKKNTSGVNDSLRSMYLAKLFQGLSEHYIFPEECLDKMFSVDILQETDHKIYSMTAYVGLSDYKAMAAAKTLEESAFLYPEGIQDNRIFVKDDKGRRLGHLSFSEDSHYVTVIPLIKEKKCQIRMRYRGMSGGRGGKRLKVDLDLRVPKQEKEHGENLHAEGRAIQKKNTVLRIIKEYESYIQYLT